MKLKFKHQKFQADAAKAVVDVFKGQPFLTPTYLMDSGKGAYQISIGANDFTGWSNHKLVPEMNNQVILENINKIQRANGIKPSKNLEGMYNLTIEMETGDCVIIVTGCKNVDSIRLLETFTKNKTSCIA